MTPSPYQIAPARWPEDADLAQRLLSHYGQYLADSAIGSAGVCLIGYEAELRALPGKYADILLARVNGEGAGCVALRRRALADGTDAVELKRLWVEPGFRKLGLGRGAGEGRDGLGARARLRSRGAGYSE